MTLDAEAIVSNNGDAMQRAQGPWIGARWTLSDLTVAFGGSKQIRLGRAGEDARRLEFMEAKEIALVF